MEFTKQEFWEKIDAKEIDLISGNTVKFHGEVFNIGITGSVVILLKGK